MLSTKKLPLRCLQTVAEIVLQSIGLAQAVAIPAVYLLDFTVNAIMLVARTLAMNVFPTGLQSILGAWFSRMVGIGGMTGSHTGGDVSSSNIIHEHQPQVQQLDQHLDHIFPLLKSIHMAVTTALTSI
ncbi:major facilitator superfamily transporter [Ceratobasidium sp. AG-Ba]|nr:major facilitator superfamily transporter [Ceratobasidium sp. AG-Ba]